MTSKHKPGKGGLFFSSVHFLPVVVKKPNQINEAQYIQAQGRQDRMMFLNTITAIKLSMLNEF